MDAEIFRRYRQGLPPFDGLRLGLSPFRPLSDYLPMPTLRRALIAVAHRLQQEQPDAPLYTFHDWHEHDSYINQAHLTSWQELWARLDSDDALYASRSRDTHVSIATYPEDCSFYFRFHVLDEDEEPDLYPGKWGWFDVTCAEPLARALVEALRSEGIDRITAESAKAYFDRAAR
jgi:hypothetical protein